MQTGFKGWPFVGAAGSQQAVGFTELRLSEAAGQLPGFAFYAGIYEVSARSSHVPLLFDVFVLATPSCARPFVGVLRLLQWSTIEFSVSRAGFSLSPSACLHSLGRFPAVNDGCTRAIER